MAARNKLSLWKDEFYVTAYELAKSGLKEADIAASLGVRRNRFRKWLDADPALRDAVRRGRESRPGGSRDGVKEFLDYSYGTLPPRLKEVWDRVVELEGQGGAEWAVQDLISGHGTRAKQHLFLHALVSSNFNKSEACRRLGISTGELDRWKRSDPDFVELVQYVLTECKQDFVEGCFLNLVRQGDSPCTIHAAKTLLSNRGYGTKVKVEGEVHHHLHEAVEFDDVLSELSVEEQALILEKVRAKRGRLPPKEVRSVEE